MSDQEEIESALTPEVNSWTSMDVYYKGFHIKKSFPNNISSDVLMKTVESLIEKGFEPSWNNDTNRAIASAKPSDLGVCPNCGAPNAWSEKKQKSYCSKTCWIKK